ncbi:cystathionine gamma-synthase [Nakamurella sp. UYEF19]|uniref:trans-sulfuration enzyme family protein n=1 Tax=Nakamurella sp. UYEF19 TaxID=1756392 RepID=UPI00339560CC
MTASPLADSGIPSSVFTDAVRGGMDPAAHNGSIPVPIYQTATFERSVVLDGTWDYSRIANPTRSALEEALSLLEHGSDAVATASGMAATLLSVLGTCHSGAHVVIPDNIYGGTWDLFSEVLPSWGIDHTAVDMRDHAAVAAALTPRTRLVWVETPSNPMMKVTDIAAIGSIAHAGGALLGVDSTFGTPALQRPLVLGADLLIHSTTKYLGGHSDVTGGVVVTRGPELAARIRRLAGQIGVVAGPFDAWLVLRGIRTLPVRMSRICASAAAVAEFLAGHPRVRTVHYPGLPGHPDHLIAARQMNGFGGVVSVEVDGTLDDAAAVCARTKIFTLAVSLGGIESLIQHPAQMTHCTTGGTAVSVPASLLRLSIGLESVEDLINDLDQALHA